MSSSFFRVLQCLGTDRGVVLMARGFKGEDSSIVFGENAETVRSSKKPILRGSEP